eukprot:7346-Heterococcus_DN1.PRE.3
MLVLFAGVDELNVALAATRKRSVDLCRNVMLLVRQFNSNSLVLLLLLPLAALTARSVRHIAACYMLYTQAFMQYTYVHVCHSSKERQLCSKTLSKCTASQSNVL